VAFVFIDHTDNALVVQGAYDQRTKIADLGGCWDAANKVWRVVFTIENLESLMDIILDITVDTELEQQVKNQMEKEEKLDKLRALAKQDASVCLRIPGLKLSLYNYQRLGVTYAVTNQVGLLLADEMGLGKTLQAIGTALFMKAIGKAKKVLIITPASLKFNWPLEIEKFTTEKYVVIDGTPEERVAQWLRDDVLFYVVNFELIAEDLFGGKKFREKQGEKEEDRKRRLEKFAKTSLKAKQRQGMLSEVRRRSWDLVVVDEAQALKHHSSARTRNVINLKAKFRMALTGTPMDGRLEELHSLMQFVAPGLLMSKTRFFQRYVETDFWGRVTGYKKISEVSQKIQPFFLRRLKKDVMKDLPDKVYQNRIVSLSTEEQRIYKELAEKGHVVTEDALAVVAVIRCKQFCNWPVMVDPTCTTSSKMDAFKEVLDEVVLQNAHKALIFSQYTEMLDVIVKVLDDMGIKYMRIDGNVPPFQRAAMQKRFNEDKAIDVMVGSEAMSTGLNFQSADYVINYDDNWSPAIMAQREDRCHRAGQRKVVTVVNFICKDTIEERIRGVIYAKNLITSQTLGDEIDDMVLKRLGPKDIAKIL
jgi:SNF2 family DNA or RNA helicase